MREMGHSAGNEKGDWRRWKGATGPKGVLVICCCITNHSRTAWLKKTDIYFLTGSVGQESGCCLAWCLWRKVSHEVVVQVSSEAEVFCGDSVGEELIPNSLTRLLPGSYSSRAGVLCCVLLHRQLTAWQLAFFRESKWESAPNTEATAVL